MSLRCFSLDLHISPTLFSGTGWDVNEGASIFLFFFHGVNLRSRFNHFFSPKDQSPEENVELTKLFARIKIPIHQDRELSADGFLHWWKINKSMTQSTLHHMLSILSGFNVH